MVSMRELQGASNMWNDICLVDPRAQIGGICMIMDLTDFRKEDVAKMFDPKFSKLGTKYFQVCISFHSAATSHIAIKAFYFLMTFQCKTSNLML